MSDSCILSFGKGLMNLLLIPVYLIFGILFLILWIVLTLTGIGPICQYICNRNDLRVLDRNTLVSSNKDCQMLEIPGDYNSATNGKPYKVFVRFTRPVNPNSCPFPIAMPNGLGATVLTISRVHEKLVELGYSVLTFDRLGVGISERNETGKSPTAEDLINELNFVLNSVDPTSKWILIGPSMGSIVAQCYIAAYPRKVVGFLNLDGLPYPFSTEAQKFSGYGKIYFVVAKICWTGLLRPFINSFVSGKESEWLFSKAFGRDIVVAQMNETNFIYNLGLEMTTMMDCASFAEKGWGASSTLKLQKASVDILCGLKPNEIIEVNEVSTDASLHVRKPCEHDALISKWSSPEEIDSIISEMVSAQNKPKMSLTNVSIGLTEKSPLNPSTITVSLTDERPQIEVTPLTVTFKSLVVRCMSAGTYMSGITPDMQMKYVAEGNQMILLAKNGARYRYPKLHHGQMFAQSIEIVKCINEIAQFCVEEV